MAKARKSEGTRGTDSVIRAKWVVELRSAHPSLPHGEVLARVRAQFGIGKTAAEQVMKVAREMLVDSGKDPMIIDRLITGYAEVYETALRRGDSQGDRNALRALDSLRRMTGAGAPDRLEITDRTVDLDAELEELSDEEVRIAAALDRRRAKT